MESSNPISSIALASALAVLCILPPAQAQQPGVAAELQTLKDQIAALQAQVAKLESRIAAAPVSAAPTVGAAPPAPPSPEEATTTVGGYGEINYNAYPKDSSRNQADLRRAVVLLGHRFDDRLAFNGEIEWEHAVTSATDRGESEIEQAFLDYRLSPEASVKTGLFLMPFGFLNLSHEPPTYHGVERNFVETRIIPSTWREGGVGHYGATESGLAWDVGLTTGFDFAKLDDASAPLAAMHQELQLAHARDLAQYAALAYRAIPGLTLGGAVFHGNTGQGNADHRADPALPDFAGIQAPLALWETHARWQDAGLDLQALYARGRFGEADRIDQVLLAFNQAQGVRRPYVPARFDGWLMQGAYTIWRRGDMSLTPFLRHEQFNTESRMPAGFPSDPAAQDRVHTFGLSFKPQSQVVFKADYQRFRDNPNNDRFDLGLGYLF